MGVRIVEARSHGTHGAGIIVVVACDREAASGGSQHAFHVLISAVQLFGHKAVPQVLPVFISDGQIVFPAVLFKTPFDPSADPGSQSRRSENGIFIHKGDKGNGRFLFPRHFRIGIDMVHQIQCKRLPDLHRAGGEMDHGLEFMNTQRFVRKFRHFPFGKRMQCHKVEGEINSPFSGFGDYGIHPVHALRDQGG